MPKYWGKNDFAHGSFPEVGEKQKKKLQVVPVAQAAMTERWPSQKYYISKCLLNLN